MSHLLTEAPIPHKAFLIARHRQGVGKEAVVGLIFCAAIHAYGALRQYRSAVHYDNTRHCVRAVHQRCRTLQHLYGADTVAVNLHSMFVTPLLAFLTHTFAYHYDAVITQSAYDRFRYAAASGNLADTRLMSQRIDDVGGCRRLQLLWVDDAYGGGGIFQFCVARNTCHHHFVQVQMAEEHIRRVILVIMIILCRHCHAKTQQRQNDIYSFHSVKSVCYCFNCNWKSLLPLKIYRRRSSCDYAVIAGSTVV